MLGRALPLRLAPHAGRYRLVVDAPGILVLRQEDEAGNGDTGRKVLMAGEIVHPMTMMEIINVIATAHWRGDLHVMGTGQSRTLSFDQGALKFATSDSIDDRLGQILFRNGIVSRAQLEQILANAAPGQRLGELCVEQGLMDQTQLFNMLQKQVEQIFYAALLMHPGAFIFSRPPESEEPPAMTFHVPVQGLLMEGVQRIDEMALFRDTIPNSDVVPHPNPLMTDKSLDETAMKVLMLCDGKRSVDDIARQTGLGEFVTTKTCYHLVKQKLIEIHSGAKVDAERVHKLVGQFNEVMQDIFIAVATYGGVARTRETLESWIQGSGYGPYFGESVDDFGAVDPEFVTNALNGGPVEHPLEGLNQALHELAAFALFAATTTLPRDQELALARDVNARLKTIRME